MSLPSVRPMRNPDFETRDCCYFFEEMVMIFKKGHSMLELDVRNNRLGAKTDCGFQILSRFVQDEYNNWAINKYLLNGE